MLDKEPTPQSSTFCLSETFNLSESQASDINADLNKVTSKPLRNKTKPSTAAAVAAVPKENIVPPASARGNFTASPPCPQAEPTDAEVSKPAPSAVAQEFSKRLEKLALHETTHDKLNAADPQHLSGFA